MDNFTFQNPTKLVFGKDILKNVGKELATSGAKKVLLLAGGGSIRKNGVYDSVVASLKEANLEFFEYWGVQPNPVLSSVNDAITEAKNNGVDALLSVGGGSVIDTTKAVAAGFYIDNVWQAFEEGAYIKKALPLYTVLTLSATGSEMNGFAVITNDSESKKWAIGGPALYPKASFVDPSVQMSLPWRQTANGAVDALSHIMEFYFLGTDEEANLALNESLMRTVIKVANSLQKNDQDYAARANLALSATLALNGVAGISLKGGDWSTHALEHSISALHPKVAHGEGLAVMFPAWISYQQKHNPQLFKRWASEVWKADNFDSGVIKMKAQYKKWGSPVSLGDLGLTATDIPALVENVLLAGRPLGQLNPLKKEDVEAIYKLAL